MELAISAQDTDVDMQQIDTTSDLLDAVPVFAPALALLSYDYPVHRISPRTRPAQPLAQPVQLLIFRDIENNVRLIKLNTVTERLAELLKAGTLTCGQAQGQVGENRK